MRNFEKHIRSSADSFKMDPAAGSFEQVMKALEKKKKRRFLFWLWFLIPGVLIAGVWMGISEVTKHKITALHSNETTAVTNYASGHLNANKRNDQSSTPLSSENTGNLNLNQPEIQLEDPVAAVSKQKGHTKKTFAGQINRLTGNKNHTIKDQTTHSQEAPLTVKTNNQETRFRNKPVTTSVGALNNEENTTATVENNITENPNEMSEPVVVANNHPEKIFTGIHSQRKLSALPAFNFQKLTDKFKPFRFAVGAYAQTGTMKNIFINNRDSTGESYVSNRQQTDTYLFSWTGGLSFRYTPKRWISIETGIAYSRYSSSQTVGTGSIGASSTQDVETADSVYTFGNVQNSILPGLQQDYVNEYDFLSIPLKVYFQKKWNWIGMEGGVGVAIDIPVYTRSFTVHPSNNFSTFTSNISDSKLAVGLQFSTQFHATFHVSRWSFYAGPVFRIRATSMYTPDYAIRQHYYFIGAETGVRFNF